MSYPKTIIGLAGRARSGKTTVARQLCAKGFHELAFADPIVDALTMIFDVPSEYRTSKKEHSLPGFNFSYRKATQTLGTDWGRRMLDPDLWIQVLANRIQMVADDSDCIVISDVRFENEAQWIRSQGGEVWHIVRPGFDGGVREHASENGIEILQGEKVLVNDKGLEELCALVEKSLWDGVNWL